jgi:hypothetical protein
MDMKNMRTGILTIAAVAVTLVLAGCGNPFGFGGDDASASGGSSTGDGTDTPAGGATAVETSFDVGSTDELTGFSFSGPSVDSPFEIENGVLSLADSAQGTGGWYQFFGPELDLDMAAGTVVAGFDFRYVDAFPYAQQNEEVAKLFFAFTSGENIVYELQLKPRMSGNAVNHLWTGDDEHSGYNNADDTGDTYLSRARLGSDIESGVDAPWYSVAFELTTDGTVTFTLYDNSGAVVQSTGSIGNTPRTIDGFRFQYRTGDAPKFYNIEVDNLSIGYRS